ncbi:hypothetical protein ACHQM5_002966 [Ranunculus cassubicifolius]
MLLITSTISAASALVLLLAVYWFQTEFPAVCFTTIMWLVIVIGFLLLTYSIINYCMGNSHGALYVIVLVLALIVLGIFVYPSKHWPIYTTWEDAKQCMLMNKICSHVPKSPMSPIQKACCTPPPICGYRLFAGISWVNATNPGASKDCSRWSNEGYVKCLDCEACKLELLNGFKKRWGKGIISPIIAVILFIVINIFDYFCGRENPVAAV